MLNIEKYKDIVLDNMNICDIDTLLRGKCTKEYRAFCEGYKCEGCKERFLKWLLEEYKEPILDDAEKTYLREVIRPFRCYVKYISKETAFIENRCRIKIVVKQFVKQSCEEWIILPSFKGDMYKGMELGRNYTLEELGL